MNDRSILILVNKSHRLSADYIPPCLVRPNVPFADSHAQGEKTLLVQKAACALEILFAAAAMDGLFLYAVSGFRSYGRQKEIYEANLREKGEEHTSLYSAPPGASEHQTGLAMDVSSASADFGLEESFADTAEGRWLAANSWRYGFIIRYPSDKTCITGYAYEPWHLRYVGMIPATYMYKNNITLEEYYRRCCGCPC
ncbi:M15 family metallopeptidase [Anaerolentibacter hominis]|uniref:M15 family metallopeptidase n=1 Tax=Anaerolentibacter hominis TaxID=3079009 RepID=UPI0031B7FD71